MTYEEAKICLPPRAKFHSSSPEGELYLVKTRNGYKQWWLTEDEDGWHCSSPAEML